MNEILGIDDSPAPPPLWVFCPEHSAPEGQYWPEQPLKPTPHSANKNSHAKPGKTGGRAEGYICCHKTVQQTQSLQSNSS